MVAGVSVMWACIGSGFVLFLTNVLGLPFELAMAIVAPILFVWWPPSYGLAAAGNESYRRGDSLDIPRAAIISLALAGLLNAVTGALTIWLLAFVHERSYIGATVIAFAAAFVGLAAIAQIRSATAKIRQRAHAVQE